MLFINFHQEVQKMGQGVMGDKVKSIMQEMERGKERQRKEGEKGAGPQE